MTDTLIMARVVNKGDPFSPAPNMEVSNRHAVVKSCARKNTQVTFTRKKVNKASMNRFTFLLPKKAGAKEDLCITGSVTTTVTVPSSAPEVLFFSFGLMSLSTQRYNP